MLMNIFNSIKYKKSSFLLTLLIYFLTIKIIHKIIYIKYVMYFLIKLKNK